MERLARDKCSSLIWKIVTYGRKKFCNIGHRDAIDFLYGVYAIDFEMFNYEKYIWNLENINFLIWAALVR
jgi:hypothetical protein